MQRSIDCNGINVHRRPYACLMHWCEKSTFEKNIEMKALSKSLLILAMLILFTPLLAKAAVVDSSSYGFTVRNEYVIKSIPDSVFRYFYRDVSSWWSGLHTFSGSAGNLIIQPKANGCFCEKLNNGGSVRHMTVIYVDPPNIIRFTGGLGPLQGMAVDGIMTINFKAEEGSTRLTVTYTVGGYSPTSLGSLAPMVDRVIGEQFEGLKTFAEGK
jgi:uncharacterized protein YndB with AHSA1/START domain